MLSQSRTEQADPSQLSPRDHVVAALVLVGGIALYWAYFVPAAILNHPRAVTHSDLHSYFLPKFIYGTRELLRGEVPLWNPYEFLGLPFLGTAQPAVFYPPKLLFFGLLEPVTAYWAFLVLHALMMAAFFLVFMRNQGIIGVGALAGAIVWCFSQSTLLSQYHPVRVACLVWTPLVFLLAQRLQLGFKASSFAALALVVAIQLFGGYPEFSLDLSLILFVYALAQWGRSEWRPPWRSLLPVTMAFVIAALLAAPQLLPLLEVVSESQRVDLAGAYARDVSFGDPFSSTLLLTLQAFPSLFVFLLIGACQKRSRSALVLYVFVLAIAAGGWQFLRLFPGFAIARAGLAWALFVPFFAAWLSAIGVARFAEALAQDAEGRQVRQFTLAAMTGLIGVACWHIFTGDAKNEYSLQAFGPTNLGALACVASASVFIAAVSLRRRLSQSAVVAGLALAMLAQMAALPFWARMIPFEFPEDPDAMAIRSEAAGAGRSFSIPNLQYGHTMIDQVESLWGMEISMMPVRYQALHEHFAVNVLMLQADWARLAKARGFLDATDVQYVVAPMVMRRKLRAHGLKLIDVGPENTAVFENPDRMGRAWVTYGARVVESADAAREYVLGPEFAPGAEVILERAPKGQYPERAVHSPTPARVERTSPSRLRVRAQLPRPGLLVVSEAGRAGWQVRVDGEPAEWLQANYLLRAVELPTGEHEIVFEYRPASWLPSLAACGIGIATLLAVGVRERRGQSTRSTPTA